MNRNLILVLGAGVLAVAALVYMTLGGSGPQDGDAVSDLPQLDSVLPDETEADAVATGQRADADASPAARAMAPAAAAGRESRDKDFVFTRLEINTGEDTPEACLAFSEDLASGETVRYEDYVRFASDVRPAIRVAGPLLCLGGLSFGTEYSVTLREGLPAASGKQLGYDETVPVSLSNRPPAIAFGSGIILPRESADGVPVTTVNVDQLKIRVFRVGHRLLSQLQEGLVDEKLLYGWTIEQVQNEQGALVWSREMAVSSVPNKTVQTLFPIREALPERAPGVYLILAEDASAPVTDNNRWDGKAAQWIVDSDLGLTTFDGTDGLRVFVRSLHTAEPVRNVRLALVARNNQILAERETGSDGAATFDPGLMRGEGGLRPVMVMAYNDEDFNYQDLRRAAFDLSDRGVSGRPAPGATDSFLYLDRGIYRPGETVQIVAMVRDNQAQALNDVPLTVIVRRPDGIEYRRTTINQQFAGSAHLPVTLSRTAPLGRWSASAYLDPKRAPIGSVSFDVQDFVPERLEVALSTDADYWTPGDAVEVTANARYLYDAPAAGLDGEATLRLVADPNPFPDYKGYDFGLTEERFSPTLVDLVVNQTDPQGVTLATGALEGVPETSKPLRADITLSIFEPGGRLTREQLSVPVRTGPVNLGIRPQFDGGGVKQKQDAAFNVIALDRDGAQIEKPGVTFQVIREVVNYQWYQIDGQWRYERIVRDRPVSGGTIDVGADLPGASVSAGGLTSGSYRLAVRDPESGARSSVRFYVGWYGGDSDGRPDRVRVVADKEQYRAGETATVSVRPPMGGKALVTVANDRVFETRMINLPSDGTELKLTVSEDWGSGAYVLVSAYRPLSDERRRAPVRAIGLAWLGVDQSARTLDVAFDLPQTVPPQQGITVPVQVETTGGGAVPRGAFVTLAAVDTGILNLTDFKPPAPEDHFFGKRRLAVDIRDDYGRLILNAKGQLGEIRSGGDGFGGDGGLNVVPTKTVALFSGIVALDDAGKAVIPLEIPDFVGELKLMAVASAPGAVGHGDQALTVRREVVGDVTLPRFLAPGDTAQATLHVNNVEGAAGAYEAVIRTTGALGETETVIDGEGLTLNPGEDKRLPVTLTGAAPGVATVLLDLTGPDDFTLSRSWDIEVRAPRLAVSRRSVEVLDPGAARTVDASQLDGFIASTAKLSMSVASSAGYDVPGLLRALDRYPYGCLEQSVSRAYPLLYFNAVAEASGIAADDGLKVRIQDAVDRVLDLQMPGGAFGMWSRAGGEANVWLSVFALDFLAQAKVQGYVVPTDALNRGGRWLDNLVTSSWQSDDARAFAFYSLARQGKARISDLRYFFDTERGELKNGMSLAMLGAALDAVGDKARGRIAFEEAVRMVGEANPQGYESIRYGSLLRDTAGVTALAAESRRPALLPALFERMDGLERRPRFTTTQEKVWMLFAAYRLGALRQQDRQDGLPVSISGTDRAMVTGDPAVMTPDRTDLEAGITVRNTGSQALWSVVTAEGVPAEAQPADAAGLLLTKQVYSLNGQPQDLQNARQSERYVVLINGRMNDNDFREMAVLDLLPAGFEIETVLPAGSNKGLYPWLPDLTATQMASARDDRFVAAFTIGSLYKPRPQPGEQPKIVRPGFAVAYVVRAVTPGTYTLPAARVEDMYAPRVYAQTAESTLRVAPAQ